MAMMKPHETVSRIEICLEREGSEDMWVEADSEALHAYAARIA
jgi:hypothetical protein